MNNDGAGATKSKPDIWACAIERPAGWNKTQKAMNSKTRSGYPATSMNNLWKDVGMGLGGNVVGYSKYGGGHY